MVVIVFLPDRLNYDSAVYVMAEVDDRYIVALIKKHPNFHQVSEMKKEKIKKCNKTEMKVDDGCLWQDNWRVSCLRLLHLLPEQTANAFRVQLIKRQGLIENANMRVIVRTFSFATHVIRAFHKNDG